jgi:TctA family transporter
MSAGTYMIFLERPIALTMLVLGVVIFAFSLKPLVVRGKDWRQSVGLEDQQS